jgi:hypothetical protein
VWYAITWLVSRVVAAVVIHVKVSFKVVLISNQSRWIPPTIITSTYEDQCGCRTCCTYPNRVWAIVPAQILTAIAFVFTVKSICDCSLVQVPNTPKSGIDNFIIITVFNGTIPDGRINNNATQRALGLFTWENIDGTCRKNGDDYDFSTMQRYWQMLASDFEGTPMFVLAVVTIGVAVGMFALLVFLWMICLPSCVAHTRKHRTVLVLFLTIGLPTVHPLMFLFLHTAFCIENNCEIGRGGKYLIAAIFLYLMAGMVLLLATKDFPGNPYKEQKPMMQFKLPSCAQPRLHVLSDSNASAQHVESVNPAPVVAMMNYSNGFADAIEIPVDSEFINRTLIESDAGPLHALNMAIEHDF